MKLLNTSSLLSAGVCVLFLFDSISLAEWSRNTFPSQEHVSNGYATGMGWSHMESTMDVSVSPLDPNFRAVVENEWGAVYTEDGLNYKPLRMRHIGTPGCSAQGVEFSRYDINTLYVRVAHDYWDSMPADRSPAGMWRSRDRGASWEHLYQPPAGGYEYDSADKVGKTLMLEDPCSLRSDHLFFGSTSDGIQRSVDGGATWEALVPSLSDRRVQTVQAVATAENETFLYAIVEKTMPRHVLGQEVPISNWSFKDYLMRWRFESNLRNETLDAFHLTGAVSGWTDSSHEGRQAAVFDGSSPLVMDVPIAGSYVNVVSVALWVQTTSLSEQSIISIGEGEYWELGTREGRVVWEGFDSSGNGYEAIGPRIDDGSWHHVVGVFGSGKLTLFVDGEEAASKATGLLSIGSGNSTIGIVGNNFSGSMDDLRVFNTRALNLNAVRGAYFEHDHKNPVPNGQLWRIRIDSSGSVSEAVRLHAPLEDFHSIEIHPHDPSRGWLIRKGMPGKYPYGGRELYSFDDYGETLTSSTAVLGGYYQTFDEVMINPANPDHVFLASGGKLRYGLQYSLDGGVTWQATDRMEGSHMPSIESWYPMDYRDFGKGLSSEALEPFSGSPFSFVPGSPNQILWISATHGGLLQSNDYGATWTSAGTGGLNKDLGQFSVAWSDPDHWSVGLYEHGFSTTTDNGESWYAETHHNNTLFYDLANQAEADGSWWTAARVGGGVAFHPEDSNIMVGTWSRMGYILRSTDAGKTWENTGFKNSVEMLADVYWKAGNPNRVYAGRMRSDDAGVTWIDTEKLVVAVSDSNSDLIVGLDEGLTKVSNGTIGMYLSSDAGLTWVPLPDPPAEAVPGLNGKSWEVTGTMRKWNCLADALIAIDPGAPYDPTLDDANRVRILLAGRSGLYEYNAPSLNGSGAESDWVIRNAGLESSTHYNEIEAVPWMGFVVFDPRPGYEHVVYAAKQNDDRTLCEWGESGNPNHSYPGGENFEPFYISTDRGVTWTKLHGLDHPNAPRAAMIESMTVDSLGRMFAATTEGVYVFSPDAIEDVGSTIDFVVEEGFVDGLLDGQSGWRDSNGTYSVAVSGAGALVIGDREWSKARFAHVPAGSAGSVFKLGTAFKFLETEAADSTQNVFRIEFMGDGSETVSLALKRNASGTYQLSFHESSGGNSWLNGNGISPESIGLANAANNQSDLVYMEILLVKGEAEDDWSVKASLYNLKDDPEKKFPPMDVFTFEFSSSREYFENPLLPAINSAAHVRANVGDLIVDSVVVEPGITSFSKWISLTDLGVGSLGLSADPDGDGISNFEEFVFGGSPVVVDEKADVFPLLSDDLVFQYRRRTDSETLGLFYQLEYAYDLGGPWFSGYALEGVQVSSVDDFTELVTGSVLINQGERVFLRLRVQGQ